jgi:hypothetical protein
VGAHRVAWALAHPDDPFPVAPLTRHTCDDPPCVNPDHLEPGTYADNLLDAIERGRWKRWGRPYGV